MEDREELFCSVGDSQVKAGNVGSYSIGESVHEGGVGRSAGIVACVEGERDDGGEEEGGEKEWRDAVRVSESKASEGEGDV